MDLRQLRYFLAIAEAGSMTRAARQLGVAQPALSLHVKTMEAALGTRLLIRAKSGVTPTEAGALLMRRARSLLDDLARTEDDIRTLAADPAGEVRLGLPGTIGTLIALPLIEAARARFPRIRLTIAEAMSGFIAGWLEEGRVDLAVLYTPSTAPGVVSTLLLEEELALLWSPDTARPCDLGLAALREVPLVLPSGMHGLRRLVDRACADAGFAPTVAIEIDSYATIKRLVAAGHGASILPIHAVQPEAAAGTLAMSPLAPPGLWRGVWLAHPSGRPASRAGEAILALTTEVINTLLADRTSCYWNLQPIQTCHLPSPSATRLIPTPARIYTF
ncbi:LysR family transcriptional regulator [Marinovum sp.]|uniref:LysR family transcriptional regulator n=1 Tax=Marinovum sp. TaxID=2024839 RepID=UPI002B26EA59|nr:LysR substrate-binding domain-containing protein [Marinovum sp.]